MRGSKERTLKVFSQLYREYRTDSNNVTIIK